LAGPKEVKRTFTEKEKIQVRPSWPKKLDGETGKGVGEYDVRYSETISYARGDQQGGCSREGEWETYGAFFRRVGGRQDRLGVKKRLVGRENVWGESKGLRIKKREGHMLKSKGGGRNKQKCD